MLSLREVVHYGCGRGLPSDRSPHRLARAAGLAWTGTARELGRPLAVRQVGEEPRPGKSY
ncbi:hypothetical protein SGA01_27690 [Streptomyces gardneri]|uniref:Uncharacterized protein n=1 Tax=Streptomyces gardneri TaxID=66892 RepID=A0A4Y3RIF0_9ACTN|nr:hypothetical protein SGA01_27690 [Streptomyces gardneri]